MHKIPSLSKFKILHYFNEKLSMQPHEFNQVSPTDTPLSFFFFFKVMEVCLLHDVGLDCLHIS